jgi:endo-1,4-beta-xylanase
MLLNSSNLTRWLALIGLAVGLTSCGRPADAAPDATSTHRPKPTSTGAPAATPTPVLTPTWTPIPTAGDTLRAASSVRGIYVGAAVDTAYLFGEPRYMNLLGREFNMLVPETEMKLDLVEPHQGKFDFAPADKLMAFAQANGMAVRGHVLVWHQAIPAWFTGGKFNRDESIQVLHDFISTTVGRYRGQVVAWDVVNEALYDDGGLRKSIWLDRIGPDYIELAFQWAHEADPDAVLFYNDYGIDGSNPKSNAVYKLLKGLKDKGVPVGGVGLQMHIRGDLPPTAGSMKANMERFGELGLSVHVTEMDVSTTYMSGNFEAKLRQQGRVYSQVAGTCLEVKACTALVVWGISDKHTWLRSFLSRDEHPLLFDDYYRYKPAYDGLLGALQDIP